MAEAIFKHIAKERGIADKWEADSAGILRWNIGGLPEPRACNVLDSHNIFYDHRGRLVYYYTFTISKCYISFDCF